VAGRGISILGSAWALLVAAPVPSPRAVVLPRAVEVRAGAPVAGAAAAPAQRAEEGAATLRPAAAEARAERGPERAGASEARPTPPAEEAEPTLSEVMSAAARVAAGTSEEDDSRLSRARAAHWAPQLRAQAGRADSEAARAGLQSGAPLRWDQQGQVETWSVSATWDLAQVIYDRDEGPLALSRVHLARRRHEVSREAADLYLERQRLLRALGVGPGDAANALLLLRCTAALDGLTGGLFEGALARAQALAVPSRILPGPSAGANQGLRNGLVPNPEQSR
jgi:hypothetical protein